MTTAPSSYQVLEELPGRGTLVLAVGGDHDGAVFLVVSVDGGSLPPSTACPGRSPRASARRLLESLLHPDQLSQWRVTGRFAVPTPYGPVTLGRLYDLRWRHPEWGPMRLCVVPVGHEELPEEDVWVNLLLALRAMPERFFAVANWQDPRSGSWRPGPVPLGAAP